jgi:parallel beta-helix repeat protein
LTGNVDGIKLLGSRNNTLELNRVSSGIGTGVYVADSNFNFFFHNGFFNNSLKSASVNSSNLWDNGFEGNFWGYEGFVDADQNGIADSPFVLGNGDKDNFPLMAEYTQFALLVDNYTYVIGVVSNSTISDFRYFRLPENFTSQISFRASAFEGSFEGLGLCRIAIPNALTRPPFEVTVDNNPPLNQRILDSNGTHSWLYFSFPYFGGEVRIVTAAPAPPFWTELWFWGIVALAVVVGALALAVFLFNRRLGSYRKTIDEFEKRLREKETSPLETARKLFDADVEERSLKIGKFEEKYGVRIRPRDSLEDVFRGLDLKKKEKEEKKDEVNS